MPVSLPGDSFLVNCEHLLVGFELSLFAHDVLVVPEEGRHVMRAQQYPWCQNNIALDVEMVGWNMQLQ